MNGIRASPVPSEWKASTQGSNRAETTEGSHNIHNLAILESPKVIRVVNMNPKMPTTIITEYCTNKYGSSRFATRRIGK
jgi:hypothetical protein